MMNWLPDVTICAIFWKMLMMTQIYKVLVLTWKNIFFNRFLAIFHKQGMQLEI